MAKAPRLKRGGRKPLQVRVLHPPPVKSSSKFRLFFCVTIKRYEGLIYFFSNNLPFVIYLFC